MYKANSKVVIVYEENNDIIKALTYTVKVDNGIYKLVNYTYFKELENIEIEQTWLTATTIFILFKWINEVD